VSRAEWDQWDFREIQAIEKSLESEREREDKRDARMMSFLITLMTGETVSADDLFTTSDQEELSASDKGQRASALSSYYAGMKKASEATSTTTK